MSNDKIRFLNAVTGDELTQEQMIENIDRSLEAAAADITALQRFKSNFYAGKLKDGDSFIDVTPALDEGYDRTGPVEVVVEVYSDED